MNEHRKNSALDLALNRPKISFLGYLFCFALLIVFAILPVANDLVVQLIKPVVILAAFFSGRMRYRLTFEKFLIILMAYISVIFVARYNATYLMPYISMVTFAFFFISLCSIVWSKKEIVLLLRVLCFSCTIYAAILIYSNSGLWSLTSAQRISYLSGSINRNIGAFTVTPGAICAILLFHYNNDRSLAKKVYYLFSFATCSYTIVALSCRSAFVSLVLGVFILLWNISRETHHQKFGLIHGLMIAAGVLLLMAISSKYLDGHMSARLFDYSDTGREDLWERAIDLIKVKPVFGGGFGYWEDNGGSMGTHNTFLTYMLISGVVGGAILAIFYIGFAFECLRSNIILPFAFAAESIMHTLTESSLDYFVFVPLVMATVILRYEQTHKGTIASVFWN